MAGGQPSNIEPYLQPGNPVTRDPLEEKATKHLQRHDHPNTTSQQHNTQPGDAVPTSLGRGVQGGSGPVDAQEARETGGQGEQLQNENVDADEQMATLGEGKVADAVQRKSGTQQVPGSGPAEEQDFASDLDRYVSHFTFVGLRNLQSIYSRVDIYMKCLACNGLGDIDLVR